MQRINSTFTISWEVGILNRKLDFASVIQKMSQVKGKEEEWLN